ncbi:hypothetical protein GCM10011608_10440 [Micromonospora sonchi]|uniref:Uncharacterized protein n=1 Tax=Micromonospora sonchi TaxID=1763543 RepID=A0A917TM21_9ACTN|nr:hypothetical protein [Micromonospora sonchi]GGM27552.1 hypothetical protein GCM10011608_10440 [Micromonospora sonchi]
MADPTGTHRLADTEDTIIGAVENGPWVLIIDPNLRRMVGEYVAETCHSIAAAAGLDAAMEYAHNAMPVRLATGGRLVDGDARDRLARHLYLNAWGDYPDAADRWDNRQVDDSIRSEFLADADAALNVINGTEN